MLSAWALEQGGESKRRFENQDVMVPWKTTKSAKKGEDGDGQDADGVVQRFCHVFREGELEEMVELMEGVSLVDSFFDTSNWCVVIKREV